ncbi:MAG: cob(I)yrinic acid a,c-diamide adenosyltransferase [Paracoccus sp. (in: a-proteobacteria)]|nr:cob(I)yrinic acid a,c-diamide adenosyltransferase [Paracoccus sp. (in: a-proteobacteria)]
MGMDDSDRHREKMAKIKAARERMMADKTAEKGLIIVHTGKGKGKSSSGFGMILRAIGWGMPCAVVQFIKGAWDTGERRVIEEHFADQCQIHVMGEGFTWNTQDRERDIAAAQAAWNKAKELIRDPSVQMVLLDEINIALRYGYLDAGEVIDFLLDEKPAMTHVVLTGRNAPDLLIEAADLVTEMTEIKHPFKAQGVKAQRGVEF